MRAPRPLSKRSFLPLWARGDLVTLGLILVAVFAAVIVESYTIDLAGGPVVKDITPRDAHIVAWDDAIIFSIRLVETRVHYDVVVHLRPISGTNSTIATGEISPDTGWVMQFKHLTSGMSAGKYFWSFVLTDPQGDVWESPEYLFTLLPPGDAQGDEVGASSARGSSDGSPGGAVYDSDASGPGGHLAGFLGEKTGFFFPLLPGMRTTLKFSHTDIHAIEKIEIVAHTLLGGNAFVVHQEFEKDPYYVLPGSEDGLYKAVHIQSTTAWNEKQFSTTVFFRLPKKFIEEGNYAPENGVLHYYVNRKLVHAETRLVGEESDYYVYAATLPGLPPFIIGADHYTWNGIPSYEDTT